MQIPRSLLDELTRDVNATSEAGRRMVEQALARLLPQFVGEDGTVVDVAGLRDAAIALMERSCSYLADVAAGRAAEQYDAMRAAQSPPHAYGASALTGREPAATEGAVRALVQKAVDGRLDAFVSGLSDRVDYEVRRAANECVALNCARDPDRPRYGRVPSGSETCGFCLMLSSFGFRWTSPEAAGHAHDGCDCRVVADFGSAEVDGYDPEGMYGRYNELLESVGGRDGLRAEWDAMPVDERAAYVARHGGKSGKAFDAYVNRRMAQEVEDSGPTWFREGDATLAGRIDAAKSKRTRDYTADNLDTTPMTNKELKRLKQEKPLEWAGYVHLSRMGFRQDLLHEDNGAAANIDVWLHYGETAAYYDLKTPRKGEKALNKLLVEGYGKWSRLLSPGAKPPKGFDMSKLGVPRMVVDNRFSQMTDDEANRQIADSMQYLSARHGIPHERTILIAKDGAVIDIELNTQ